MRDDRLTVLGLLLLAVLARAGPSLYRHVRGPAAPISTVLYAPGPGQPLLWSPASRVPAALDGLVLGGSRRPPRSLGGWPGLLFGAPLDLNRAGAEDLAALSGIGPKTAGAILATRRTLCGYGAVDDLLAVPGIGPKTLERLRPLVTVGTAAPADGRPGE